MRKAIGIIILFALLIGGIFWGIYQFKRSWNYSWAYESRVQETADERICAMVKPEHLIDPSICK